MKILYLIMNLILWFLVGVSFECSLLFAILEIYTDALYFLIVFIILITIALLTKPRIADFFN